MLVRARIAIDISGRANLTHNSNPNPNPNPNSNSNPNSRLVKIITGIEPKKTVNPDEAVSLGAAVMAGILDGEQRKEFEVLNYSLL
jgi:hypothetical protein